MLHILKMGKTVGCTFYAKPCFRCCSFCARHSIENLFCKAFEKFLPIDSGIALRCCDTFDEHDNFDPRFMVIRANKTSREKAIFQRHTQVRHENYVEWGLRVADLKEQ